MLATSMPCGCSSCLCCIIFSMVTSSLSGAWSHGGMRTSFVLTCGKYLALWMSGHGMTMTSSWAF
eukprot:CAMPEP_0117692868 /NCGR_PEP_ID=MMETSP0804-20121206/26554_1 /TAXON_ID=1074897 /ORGANISM="Tetraselmis astigmatica, Strain CCMP880" /LENGTH=64 /DNA_ID=CAMNT_0005506339 /DNA_START=720 /DNA_END=914 /DNA_ORIENTATION=+